MLTLFDTPIYDFASRQQAAEAAERAGNYLVATWLRQKQALTLDGNLQQEPNPTVRVVLEADTPLNKVLQPLGPFMLNWVKDTRSIPLRIQCSSVEYQFVNLNTGAVKRLNPKADELTPTAGRAILETGVINDKETMPLLHVSTYDLGRFGLTFVPAYEDQDAE